MINKKWIPFYRLQVNTRDKLWGELADYSKDINFMKKINNLYNEYALINNKIDIMNAVRLQLNLRPYEDQSGEVIPDEITKLNTELSTQLSTSIDLGKKANEFAKECLDIIKKRIETLS